MDQYSPPINTYYAISYSVGRRAFGYTDWETVFQRSSASDEVLVGEPQRLADDVIWNSA